MSYRLTEKIDIAIKQIQLVILIASSTFITIGIGTGALLRYLFKKDLYGAEEFITIAAFWMYFIGAVYATHTGKHIAAEIFSSLCKNRKIVYRVKMLSLSVTIALSLLYSYWGWEFFYWSLKSGGRSVVWLIPLVWGHTAVFVSFVFMTFYFLVELFKVVREYRAALSGTVMQSGEAAS